jgi:hypothetical protein
MSVTSSSSSRTERSIRIHSSKSVETGKLKSAKQILKMKPRVVKILMRFSGDRISTCLRAGAACGSRRRPRRCGRPARETRSHCPSLGDFSRRENGPRNFQGNASASFPQTGSSSTILRSSHRGSIVHNGRLGSDSAEAILRR